MSRNLYQAISRRLPGRIAAVADRVHPRLPDDYGPMNGQIRRMELVRRIFRQVDFDLVMETGTFRAQTTRFLACQTAVWVHSAEIDERYLRYSRAACSAYPNIVIHAQDSRDMLAAIAKDSQISKPFLYLDAHWQADVPRHAELEIVRDRWRGAVVIIDDFFVPSDPGFGYARYGQRRLDEDYLPPLPGWSLFYPRYPSESETGARRGFALLTGPESSFNYESHSAADSVWFARVL